MNPTVLIAAEAKKSSAARMAKGESGESVRLLYDIFISLKTKFIGKTKNPTFGDFTSNYLLYIVLYP